MHPRHIIIGQSGEEAAALYLREKGYKILGKNVKVWKDEIDLIVQKGETVVFVEVKSRATRDGWEPSERVDHTKIRHIKRAAMRWLEEQAMTQAPARIDVIGVCEGKVVEHFEDVTS